MIWFIYLSNCLFIYFFLFECAGLASQSYTAKEAGVMSLNQPTPTSLWSCTGPPHPSVLSQTVTLAFVHGKLTSNNPAIWKEDRPKCAAGREGRKERREGRRWSTSQPPIPTQVPNMSQGPFSLHNSPLSDCTLSLDILPTAGHLPATLISRYIHTLVHILSPMLHKSAPHLRRAILSGKFSARAPPSHKNPELCFCLIYGLHCFDFCSFFVVPSFIKFSVQLRNESISMFQYFGELLYTTVIIHT